MKNIAILAFASAASGGIDVTTYGPFTDQQAANNFATSNLVGDDVTWRVVDLVDPNIQTAHLGNEQPGQQQTAN